MVEKKSKKWTRWFGLIIGILLLSLVFGQVGEVKLVEAVGGAYSITFRAADSPSYIPNIPYPGPGLPDIPNTAPATFGSADGSLLIPDADYQGKPSLEPSDMAMCQIVPFFFLVVVNGDTTPENGSIIIEASWFTQTTSGSEFGFNKDIMIYSAFVDTSDLANVGLDGDETVTLLDEYWIDTAGDPDPAVGDDAAFIGEFQVDNLDDGDTVVVEVWTVLDCTKPDKVVGNIQVALEEAYTNTTPPDVISTGNQTNPLLQADNLEPAPVELSVIKYDDNEPKPIISTETAPWKNTIVVTASIDGDTTIDYVAMDVVVTDILDPWVQIISDDPYVAVTNEYGYVIAPQFLVPVGEPPVDEPYRTCEWVDDEVVDPDGLGGTLTCKLNAVPEDAIVTITYWVKAVSGVPVGSTCEGDSETDSTTSVATECPPTDPSPLGYDVFNRVDLTTVAADTTTDDNWDEEPKDITNPTAVDLIHFKATPEEGQVVLTWETASEVDTFGFDLLRADSITNKWTVIATILSNSPGGNSGATYEYQDTNVTYWVPYVYWLEEITLDERQSEIFGPAIVLYPYLFMPVFVW